MSEAVGEGPKAGRYARLAVQALTEMVDRDERRRVG